jgi:hypothetical protein
VGLPSEEVRRAILEEEGQWGLRVAEPDGQGQFVALKVLREAQRLTVAQTADLRRQLPGVVARGTRTEMEGLRALLAAEGLACSIEPAP